MKPKFIDHIVIIVRNVPRSKKFYGRFLGRPLQATRLQIVYEIGNTKIFFCSPGGKWAKTDKNKGGINHLAFGVKTISELKKLGSNLNAANIKNSGIKIDKYGKKEFIWFDDPNGYRLEFYKR